MKGHVGLEQARLAAKAAAHEENARGTIEFPRRVGIPISQREQGAWRLEPGGGLLATQPSAKRRDKTVGIGLVVEDVG